MVSIKSILSIFLIANLLMTIYLNEYIAHIFFFFSYWGVFTSLLAMYFSVRAYNYKKNNQAPAVIFTEISICYNILICPIFWALLAPIEFSKYPKWRGLDLVTKIHLTTTHTIPIIASLTNIFLTKNMVFFPEDWKIMFLGGVIYIYANYLGTQVEGSPMYPIADWTNVPFTILCYLFAAILESFIFYHVALHLKTPKAL